MKIGILTVPFNNNYGGFLQAYALKTIVESLGHEVIFIQRKRNRPQGIKYLLKRILFKIGILTDKYEERVKLLSINTSKFVEKYLTPITEPYFTHRKLRKCTKMGIDCFIVGSDQVWRYEYAKKSIDDYFFSFLQDDTVKRLSYAASFGIDTLDYPLDIRLKCVELLKSFSGISVREDSGVKLLGELNVPKNKVSVVLDPTLLLTKDAYKNRLIKDNFVKSEKYLLSYILDDDKDKLGVVNNIAKEKGLKVLSAKAQTGNVFNLSPLIPVEEWLSLIYHADFIVTDSFHGAVFSILFNRPFLVYGNKQRGYARFSSLLSMFGLEDRYLEAIDQIEEKNLRENINWENVNEMLEKKRNLSMSFLQSYLS